MSNVFTRWLQKRNEGPLANFSHNTEVDYEPEDYENLQKDLIDILFNRYHSEFINFIEGIANQRSDNEMTALVQKLNKNNRTPANKPKHSREPDDVVMPVADKGAGESEE